MELLQRVATAEKNCRNISVVRSKTFPMIHSADCMEERSRMEAGAGRSA